MDYMVWNFVHKRIYRGCNLFFGCWNIGYFSTFMAFRYHRIGIFITFAPIIGGC